MGWRVAGLLYSIYGQTHSVDEGHLKVDGPWLCLLLVVVVAFCGSGDVVVTTTTTGTMTAMLK
jgi:hypothetical protein